VIKKLTDSFICECIRGHVFAGSTPFGESIYKNNFVFGLGFRKAFFPGTMEKLNALRPDKGCKDQTGEEKEGMQLKFHDANLRKKKA
jgi:hypothetical protein